jgi:hypothetical protein
MGNDSVKLQPLNQGVHQGNLSAAEPKGLLTLQNLSQLKPLAGFQHGFASVKSEHLKQKLKFTDAPHNQPDQAGTDDPAKAARKKTSHIHEVAFHTGQSDQYPSVKKFWDKIKTALKDTRVGKFIQRNVLHHVVDTKVDNLQLNAEVGDNKKTTLVFDLKSKSVEEVQGEHTSQQVDGQSHRIEVTFDRLRNQRSLFNPKRWIGNDGRTGKVEDILANLQKDVARQVRLRNLGIGLTEEKKFAADFSGLLAALPDKTSKRGALPPKVADYSSSELHTLKIAAEELGFDRNKIALLDKAIAQRDSNPPNAPRLTKAEEATLRHLSLEVEVNKLQAIANVCADYAFTDAQLNALEKLASALKGSSAELTKMIPSVAQSIREMSIMSWSGLSRSEEGVSFNDNLKQLISGSRHGILPMGLVLSPIFMSPQALRKQAENCETYAMDNSARRESQIKGLEIIEKQFEDAGHGSAAGRQKLEGMAQKVEARKNMFLERAEQFKQVAKYSAGCYRFQGMLPILAANNGEELDSFLRQNLKDAFDSSTRLQAPNRSAQGGALTLGVLGMGGSAIQGNPGTAVLIGGMAWAAAKYFEHDGDKYTSRFQGLASAILNGIASGSEEQLIQANRLIAEEKCEKTVKSWAKNQQENLIGHSVAIGKSETVSDCDLKLNNLASNKKGDRDQLIKDIKTDLSKKIESLETLAVQIKTTNTAIDSGPDGQVTIHSSLTVDEVRAQEAVQKALTSAGVSVATECQALQGSFEILQSAYQKEGKEKGRYFEKIEKVEESIAESIQNWKQDRPSGLQEGLNQIREDLSEDAPKLTNNHATHLHQVVDHLENATNKSEDLKKTMLRVGEGLASPSIDYLTGSLDQHIFAEGARFVTEGKFKEDLGKLNAAQAEVTGDGKNCYALFRDKLSRKAISEPLGKLIDDAKEMESAWGECLTYSSAMVKAAQEEKDIHSLKSTLKTAAQLLDQKSQPLQRISDQYKDLRKQGANFKFEENISNLHQAALRVGVARLVGLESNPLPESCHKALDLLSGPLADPDLHNAVAKYLEKPENQANKAEALQSIFSALPPAGKSPMDWTSNDTESWKTNLNNKSDGIEFLGKLFDYANGETDLNSALKTANMISSGDTQKSIVADLYSAPIHRFLQQASKNENLKTVFPNAFKQGDLNLLFQNLANKVDTLVSYGLDEDLKGKTPSVGALFKNFQSPESRANLSETEFETLLKFSKVLADLQATPEATRQHKVRLAALDLLANVDESFKTLQDPKSANPEKLNEVFTPKPTNLQEWEKFKDSYQTTYKEYKKLEASVHETKELKNGSEFLFQKLNGNVALLNPSSQDVQERRDILLQAHRLYSSGDIMAKFKNSSSLVDKAVVLTKTQAQNELKAGLQDNAFELLKWTNVDTCQEDKKLIQLDQKILHETIASNQYLNFRFGEAGHIHQYQEKSEDVRDHLRKYGKRPAFEGPLDTMTRIFAKGGGQLSDRLHALRNYLWAENQLQEIGINLKKATAAVEKSSKERDKLLGDHQSIVFKNAVRAEILTYCVDKGIDPSSLAKDPHEAEIKALLNNIGWSDDTYPAGLDIPKFFEEAKIEGFLETWKMEAGTMRSDLARIENQIDQALKTLKASLESLSKEIDAASKERLIAMRDEGKVLAREGSALLVSANAHAANLLTNVEVPNSKSFAKKTLAELCQRLTNSHPDKKDAIAKWQQEALEMIRESDEWETISNSVSSDLDKLHDTLLDCKSDSRPPYFESLVASRALDFDRAAVQDIRKAHDETAGKVETEIAKIETLRTQFASLTVKDALPANIVAESNGDPRTWVRHFFKENKAAIQSNERYGNCQDEKQLASHFNKMRPLDFLNLFKEGADLHTFFLSGADTKKDDFSNLVNQMGTLREGLEDMGTKLFSYQEGSFENFLDSSKFAPPSGEIKQSPDLNSIGKLLKKSVLPTQIKDLQNEVEKTKINLKSERQYTDTVARLELDLIQKKEVQDAEDMESQLAEDEYAVSEAGDFELDIQDNEVGERNSGQGALEEFMHRDSFSSLRAQQLEQMVQNQPVSPARPPMGTLSNGLLQPFQGSEQSQIQIRANTEWRSLVGSRKLDGNQSYLNNYQHVAVEATGYCSLTAMATYHGMKTSELITRLQDVARQRGEENLVTEMLDIMSKDSTAFEPTAVKYQSLFAAAGLSFWVLAPNEAGSVGVGLVGRRPAEGEQVPAMLFTKELDLDPTAPRREKGHFDLLAPSSHLVGQVDLPFDASRYVQNDHKVHLRA